MINKLERNHRLYEDIHVIKSKFKSKLQDTPNGAILRMLNTINETLLRIEKKIKN
jgi:hypothetical protein